MASVMDTRAEIMQIVYGGIRQGSVTVQLQNHYQKPFDRIRIGNTTYRVQEASQRKAPVDTGTLKRSIGLEIRDGGLTAEVEPTAEYAAYVEYGTRYMSAQPYMRPSYTAQKEKFKSDLKKLTR